MKRLLCIAGLLVLVGCAADNQSLSPPEESIPHGYLKAFYERCTRSAGIGGPVQICVWETELVKDPEYWKCIQPQEPTP